MGKSLTIHCIGQRKNGNLEYGITKLEVYQKSILYPEIEYWYSQTIKGTQILGNTLIYTKDFLLNPPKGIIDCICKKSCPLCRGSRKTTKKEMSYYRAWQIEEFRNR